MLLVVLAPQGLPMWAIVIIVTGSCLGLILTLSLIGRVLQHLSGHGATPHHSPVGSPFAFSCQINNDLSGSTLSAGAQCDQPCANFLWEYGGQKGAPPCSCLNGGDDCQHSSRAAPQH